MLLARVGSLIGVGLVLATCVVAGEEAQEKTASVAVEVVDENGAVVAKAQVKFSIASEDIAAEITDDTGKARARLAPGAYNLVALSPGFWRFSQHIQVHYGENRIHVVLKIGCPSGECGDVTEVVPIDTTPMGRDTGLVGPDEQQKAGTRYEVTLRVDFAQQLLEGKEKIHFEGQTGKIEWQKQDNLRIRSANASGEELALMSEEYLAGLESNDDVALLAHELAHQWWGVSIGIRSWSDFWLNEGMAEFMADAYLEQHQGRAAYDVQIAELKRRMSELRKRGRDRPLHWERWKDAHEALGAIPYVKGALFLDRLRTELGEEKFWRGVGLYTSRNVRRLVDSHDFESAMEEASGRDLGPLFDSGVFH
jgi:hypothetical protein